MGKPYSTELRALPSTYSWARSQPIHQLARAIERLQTKSLIAVGSGGSFSVCQFAAHLHGRYARNSAVPLTPLQATSTRTAVSNAGILVPTAAGNNPDVVAAVQRIAVQEPHTLLVLCGSSDCRVASVAKRLPIVDFVAFDLPSGKDGFLATNSLLAFCVLLYRAYVEAAGLNSALPKSFRSLLDGSRASTSRLFETDEFSEILNRDAILLLHGPDTISAATDLESKFTEAALGNIKPCDYRQFAHGRHHWVAKRPTQTSVLTIETRSDAKVASQTLEILPPTVLSRRIHVPGEGAVADIAAMCIGFFITSAAGKLRGIDPGRPGVPPFGRKLYHANAFRSSPVKRADAIKTRAIERKTDTSIYRLQEDARLAFWADALATFTSRLTAARFHAVVTDYDGTLCDDSHRHEPIPAEITASLASLLNSGMHLGIATGRGKSVREKLREGIPKSLWPQVIVGYYNGSQIIPLASNTLPNAKGEVCEALKAVADKLSSDPLLTMEQIELRPDQITLERPRGVSLELLWKHAESVVRATSPGTVRVMRSGHSVDIVPESVSKVAVVDFLQQHCQQSVESQVLRIGDRGEWPGNDAQLLASPYGLSAYEVSMDPHSCWNLAPPGIRGWQATLRYLNCLKPFRGSFRFHMPAHARG